MNTSNRSFPAIREESTIAFLAMMVSLMIPSFTLRIVQILETNSSFGIGDLRGFAADMIVICGVALLLVVIRNLSLWRLKFVVLMFIPIFWCSLTYGNYEHIKALGAMSTWAYIAFLLDPTFVNGSLLQATRPVLLSMLALVVVALSWYSNRSSISNILSIKLISLAALPALALFFWTSDSSVADWRKNNHFIHNIFWTQNNTQVAAEAVNIPGLYPFDLNGQPRVGVSNPGKNVLLLILEGVSGAYLDSVAEAHSVTGVRPRLPSLDKFGKEGLVFANFINHQRQTNRGLYSLICGDLPKQKTSAPKMSEFGASGKELNCLPQVLRKKGYRTTFIQSAPLPFMGKDKFMPAAGFDEIYGSEWFGNGEGKGQWGVDDNILFEKTAGYIEDKLQNKHQPWFLTVLTAGTHHPFTVPESFEGTQVPGSFSHAIEYLDRSLNTYLGRLKSTGVLENTLLVITSDESFGRDKMDDLNELLLTQAFGSLTIATPENDKGFVKEPFMQMDVALSILDYLGYTNDTGSLAGRSVFRQYEKSRVLPFANTYLRTSAMISDYKTLLTCEENLNVCQAFKFSGDMLVSSAKQQVNVEDSQVKQLKDIAKRSFYTGILEQNADWQLIDTDRQVEIADLVTSSEQEQGDKRIRVFGHQYLSVAANSTIRVEIDFDVMGDENADLKVRHRLHAIPTDEMPSGLEYTYFQASKKEREKSGIQGESALGVRPKFKRRDYLFKESWEVKSGSRVKLSYQYTTGESLERLNCNLDLKNFGSKNVVLKFKRAKLFVEKATDDSKEGLTVIEMSESS